MTMKWPLAMPKKKLEGVIFDLDGVLVTTDKFHYQAWKMLADELELDFSEDVNHQLRGVSRAESLRRMRLFDSFPLTKPQSHEARHSSTSCPYRSHLSWCLCDFVRELHNSIAAAFLSVQYTQMQNITTEHTEDTEKKQCHEILQRVPYIPWWMIFRDICTHKKYMPHRVF